MNEPICFKTKGYKRFKKVVFLLKMVEVIDEKYQTFEIYVLEARLEVSLCWKWRHESLMKRTERDKHVGVRLSKHKA